MISKLILAFQVSIHQKLVWHRITMMKPKLDDINHPKQKATKLLAINGDGRWSHVDDELCILWFCFLACYGRQQCYCNLWLWLLFTVINVSLFLMLMVCCIVFGQYALWSFDGSCIRGVYWCSKKQQSKLNVFSVPTTIIKWIVVKTMYPI